MPHQDRKHPQNTGQSHSHSHMSHMSMMVLCVALMVGAIYAFSGFDIAQGLSWALWLPLALCLGGHFLMHRFMGHSENPTQENPDPVKVKSDIRHDAKNLIPQRIPKG